ncbi:hypothetical protein GOODEAATRI_033813 [Goodea atripinnis]|uniref:Uncharacterized protein n=1 Tax=Goodea atripinnis TaxID=208336 RepID=A0ABV0PJC5_9TELE
MSHLDSGSPVEVWSYLFSAVPPPSAASSAPPTQTNPGHKGTEGIFFCEVTKIRLDIPVTEHLPPECCVDISLRPESSQVFLPFSSSSYCVPCSETLRDVSSGFQSYSVYCSASSGMCLPEIS